MPTETSEITLATPANKIVIDYLGSNGWSCDLEEDNDDEGCSDDQAEVELNYTINGEESGCSYACFTHVNEKLAQLFEHEMQDIPHILVVDGIDAEGRRANFEAVGGELWARMTIIEKPDEEEE
jgi:hypothetical protein